MSYSNGKTDWLHSILRAISCILKADCFGGFFKTRVLVWLYFDKRAQSEMFCFFSSKMTAALLFLLLAGPLLLVTGGPVYFKANNGTTPLVLWHGMGEWLCYLDL